MRSTRLASTRIRRSAIRYSAQLTLLASASVTAAAQGRAADYQRADSIRARLDRLVLDNPGAVTWLPRNRLWYRKSVQGGNVFVLVDAPTQQKTPAFDHQRLAATLSTILKKPYTDVTLPFRTFTFVDNDQAIQIQTDTSNRRLKCTLADYKCVAAPPLPPPGLRRAGDGGRTGAWATDPLTPADNSPVLSPDSAWEASVRNYNIAVRQIGTPDWTTLSTDGTEGDAYVISSVVWSPDSKRLAAMRVVPGYRREVHYVESSPEDQVEPRHSTRFYLKPGDRLDVKQPVVFEIQTKRQIFGDRSLFPNAYTLFNLAWRKDGRAVVFEYNQRGHGAYKILEIDATTGQTRAVVDEQAKTFFNYYGHFYRSDVSDGKEIIWMSERDGWNHLYLYDGTTGQVKNQITKGDWVVREVSFVDSTARQIWFGASGMYAGKDPYLLQYYRINFDGTGLTPVTDADANHSLSFSPDRQYYVDSWSRVDLPSTMQLRRTSDRAVLATLEQATIAGLASTGWRTPEVFATKGRDGTTDIWGIIVRPTNFDPKKVYPVIEYIYAGPHSNHVPKTFSTQGALQAQAELGFIVVQIDGMGTQNRSKAFHDVAWKNLKDAGFPDRTLWHKAVAAKYRYYDISRVGIYGTSAGGQNSMGALLFHPDFYKVAVSAAGCHDNRMDKLPWNEQWMGWPIGPEYAASSNVDNAHLLKGKLLLIVGEMDTNVDPSSTFQVVHALVKATKTFDLLVLPGQGHTEGGTYGERKRFDFFVHHLMGVEPPERNMATSAK